MLVFQFSDALTFDILCDIHFDDFNFLIFQPLTFLHPTFSLVGGMSRFRGGSSGMSPAGKLFFFIVSHSINQSINRSKERNFDFTYDVIKVNHFKCK